MFFCGEEMQFLSNKKPRIPETFYVTLKDKVIRNTLVGPLKTIEMSEGSVNGTCSMFMA